MIDKDVVTISKVLEVPAEKLYMLSNNHNPRQKRIDSKYENYHKVVIHRGRGHKNRVLNVPNEFLKLVQRRILDNFLCQLNVSRFSTAYCKGKSLLDNSLPHVGKECILKLDISHFFDSITDDSVYLVFKQLGLSVSATSLLTHLCTFKNILPQGAPTSPCLANLIMNRFDSEIGEWCSKHNITYTRYCDDMTFSGDKSTVKNSNIIGKVRTMLDKIGLKLNDKKTVFINSSQQQRVTGVVVNEKPAISCEQRRKIRQEVYYCTKFGVKESIQYRGLEMSEEKYLISLLGRISFALQVEPDNNKMQNYFNIVKQLMKV